jgi:hypothetical protein
MGFKLLGERLQGLERRIEADNAIITCEAWLNFMAAHIFITLC